MDCCSWGVKNVKYKWLLFDADGTLFDFDKVEERALLNTFAALGHECDPRCAQIYRQIDRDIWIDFENGKISQERLRTRRFELLFEAIGIECDPIEFSRKYLAHLATGSDLIDGAEDVVKALHGRVGLLLITNGLTDVQRPRFARSSVLPYFSDVVISEEVGAAKPDPKIFDIAFARMGFPNKEDVLIVGDSLTSDIRGGNLYGIDTCWFNPQDRPRDGSVAIDYEIGTLGELLPLLSSNHDNREVGARSKEVDVYLAELDPERREALSRLREVVLSVAPHAAETMRLRMPTYETDEGVLCAFASQKRYMSLYMDTELVEQHRADLAGLSVGKSCIRFRRLDNLPLDVVRAILRETWLKRGSG